jgi:hypothetical protein
MIRIFVITVAALLLCAPALVQASLANAGDGGTRSEVATSDLSAAKKKTTKKKAARKPAAKPRTSGSGGGSSAPAEASPRGY